ncbi:MAG TPA: hypothetical protein PLY88_02685 [Candidatus Omnitrophota bacterium]|nr:hypothetical protein [Candidatus Omnitrophota bacterium]HRK61440.1 hypothetical protein [Candidatus Omnitrophota bacterium]
MKSRISFLVLMTLLVPAVCFASEPVEKKRGILSGILYLEGRGLSNLFLFPAEWGHLPKSETRGGIGYLPSLATHLVTRVFSGVADIVWMPIMYPFSKYDDSIPKNMGWGEFPWQKGSEHANAV